jgi:hypothetical protein
MTKRQAIEELSTELRAGKTAQLRQRSLNFVPLYFRNAFSILSGSAMPPKCSLGEICPEDSAIAPNSRQLCYRKRDAWKHSLQRPQDLSTGSGQIANRYSLLWLFASR